MGFAHNAGQDFTYLIHPQGTVAIGNKIENLLSPLATLEALFETCPWNVEEQRHRSELILYAVILPLDSVLSSFQ